MTNEDNACPLPDGEYAIIEMMGHRTLVGRVCEVERFGTKLCAIEPVFGTGLLGITLIGGGSFYQFTPCSKEVAWDRRPRSQFSLPPVIAATLDPAMLPAPSSDAADLI